MKRIQLFLIPFAGGNTPSFNKLISCIDEGIESIPIEYAGRGKQRGKDHISNYVLFVDDVADSIPVPEKPPRGCIMNSINSNKFLY